MGDRYQDDFDRYDDDIDRDMRTQEAVEACNDLADQVYYDRLPEHQMRATDQALDRQLNAYLRNQAQGVDPGADAILQGLVPKMPRGFGYAPETLAQHDADRAFNACIDQRLPDVRRGRGGHGRGHGDRDVEGLDPWGNTGRGRDGGRW